MPLQVRTFNQILSQLQQTLSNNTPAITNFRSGSVVLALLQSVTGNSLGLQQLIVHVYNVARLATSTGSDVDSYVNDFGLSRLAAQPASGTLTLSRTSTGTTLLIPTGGVTQTLAGVQFAIIADASQPSWNPSLNEYEFQTTDLTIPVTVQATTAGANTNVAPNTITQIVSGLIGVSSVTNALGFYNGSDIETDSALRLRFTKYISSLATANNSAIAAAILGVQVNLRYKILEYVHFNGSPFVAGFTVVVCDVSGNTSGGLITSVTTAVNVKRAAGISFEVDAPTKETINVSLHVSVLSGGNLAAAQISAASAITAYINGLDIGQNVSYADLIHAAETATGVYAVSSVLINGVAADFSITSTELAVPGTVTFS